MEQGFVSDLVVKSETPSTRRVHESARELLEQARESAAARGYGMVERRAGAELSKLS